MGPLFHQRLSLRNGVPCGVSFRAYRHPKTPARLFCLSCVRRQVRGNADIAVCARLNDAHLRRMGMLAVGALFRAFDRLRGYGHDAHQPTGYAKNASKDANCGTVGGDLSNDAP